MCCEVRGGADGVMINGDGVRLLRCRILGAQNLGIRANPDFVIQDSTVQGCGGYGMKTRGGCERRGRNDIQAGPWDGHMQFGDGMGMIGMGSFSGMPFGMGGGAVYGDENGEEQYSDEEYGPYGFTHEEEMELLAQGVKPWEDDAHAVLEALRGDH